MSGGADSVALAVVLAEWRQSLGVDLAMAHLDHRIRDTSAEDAEFVSGLAEALGAEYIEKKVPVARLARRLGISLEMAARQARYDFFERAARRLNAQCAATAHTADDQAETVILKLARGAGPQGLGGMPYKTLWKGLLVVRPMLDVCRREVVSFLRRKDVAWREDVTNRDLRFLRNRVRHEVIPYLEEKLNPRLRQALVRTATLMRDENEWIEGICAELVETCRIRGSEPIRLSVDRLSELAAAARRRVVRSWLVGRGVDALSVDYGAIERIEGLLVEAKGTRFADLPGSWRVSRRYGDLDLERAELIRCDPYRVRLHLPGETMLAAQGLRVAVAWSSGILTTPRAKAGTLPAKASFRSAAVARSGVYIRSWKPGDRIKPMGMGGTRKLQDVFVDQKVGRDQRPRVPVLECRGEIIWVPGYSVARGWEVLRGGDPALHVHIERCG